MWWFKKKVKAAPVSENSKLFTRAFVIFGGKLPCDEQTVSTFARELVDMQNNVLMSQPVAQQMVNLINNFPTGIGILAVNGNGVLEVVEPGVFFRSPWVAAPAESASPGNPGDEAYDANYHYVYTAGNGWGRVQLDTGW